MRGKQFLRVSLVALACSVLMISYDVAVGALWFIFSCILLSHEYTKVHQRSVLIDPHLQETWRSPQMQLAAVMRWSLTVACWFGLSNALAIALLMYHQ